jgi:eukaryotic-like serine/threonine-protein kinase
MADQRYTITERVDQGGMAEVFRGVAEGIKGFKKNVAIKRILPNLTKNKKFVSMFLDEARLSLHLQHANIVHVFDIGIADTSYFIVMEYVDGVNLKGLIEHQKKLGRRMRVPHTLWLMAEVCKGLAYAHEAADPETGRPLGIVHRDISPPNILISRQAEVKLVDFGLAKATSQLETTDPGVVKGKFSYLSPEAASGQDVDHRADIFAVGILLWEMLTGRRLFYGETDYQTVELVRQAKIPSVQAINPEVDADLEAVVRKALARDPRDRYQSAGDLQEAIAQILFSRGMKVTNQDVRALVLEAVADRDRNKARSPAAGKQLIDALIVDEMQKFTSLDHFDQPLPVGDGSGGDQALDPGSFIDTSGWADEVGGATGDVMPTAPAPIRAVGSPTNARVAPPGMGTRASGSSSGMPATRQTGRAATPQPSARPASVQPGLGEVDSLQQILEPDRTGVNQKVDKSARTTTIAIVVALVLAVAVGGGLVVFKDQIFGSPSKVPTKSSPTHK